MKHSAWFLCWAWAASLAAAPLPISHPEAEAVNPARLERVNTLVKSFVESGKHAGVNVLILRHGKVIHNVSFGLRDADLLKPMEPDTICRIYSMTKVVTGVATLQLYEADQLQLDDPIAKYLPELKDLKVLTGGTADAPTQVLAKTQPTVRMCLNHTAGFTYDFFSGSPVHELYKRADLWNAKGLEDFIQRVAKLPLLAEPGTAFNYSISDDVLGLLIQRVSGVKFEEYIATHITGPLGMEDTFFDVPADKMDRLGKLHRQDEKGKLRTIDPIIGAYAEPGRGIPAGGAGLFSTIGDYGKFAQMLANGGSLDGTRILSRKMWELGRLNSLGSTANPLHSVGRGDGWGLFSGVRLNVADAGEPGTEGTLFWSGAATTHFFADPGEDLVGLVFCQHDPFDPFGLFTRFRTAVYQALD